MDQVFDAFAGSGSPRMAWRLRGFPAVNVWEDAECLYAEAELPGITTDDIEVHVQGDELSIKGSRKAVYDDESVYHRRERGTGDFARYLTLPVEINASKVDATLNNGVLLVTLPKAASARPRQIAVKAP
jgi:HSP20 family protein